MNELLTERQKAEQSNDIIRYKECDRLIHAMYVLSSSR